MSKTYETNACVQVDEIAEQTKKKKTVEANIQRKKELKTSQEPQKDNIDLVGRKPFTFFGFYQERPFPRGLASFYRSGADLAFSLEQTDKTSSPPDRS